MDRRTICLSLAMLYPANATFAQTTGQPTAGSQPAAGPDEIRHANDTLAVGGVMLETSRVALAKGGSAVKRFAELETAEQETIAAVLKQRGHAPAQSLDAPGQAMVGRLKNTGGGSDFDRAYVEHQLEGHVKLLEIQEAYLGRGQDPFSRAVGMLARSHIKEHIKDLEVVRSQIAA
jgi:putative membrane protein